MLHTLSSQPDHPCASRMTLAAVLMLAGSFASATEPQAKEKTDTKEPPGLFRAYLPAIRQKALLDSERQAIADLKRWIEKYDLWLEGGGVNLVQRAQIEEEFLRGKIHVLRRETDYRDALDQLGRRFHVSEERHRQMEDTAISPLTKVFQRYEEFSRDYEASRIDLAEVQDAKDVAKLRPALIKILTEPSLVKNTTFPKRFLKRWDEWKTIDDKNKLLDRTLKIRNDLKQLHKQEAELVLKGQVLPKADRQRRDDLKFELDVGEFQLALLIYEEQPWKKVKEDVERLKQQREVLYGIRQVSRLLLDHAYIERQTRLDQDWPKLDSVRVKDVDLFACEWDKAVGTVTSLLKAPDAQRIGKKRARHIRSLAESYPIQKRLFQIAFLQKEQIKKPPELKSDPQPDVLLPGLVGSLRAQPAFNVSPFSPGRLLKREAAYKRARRQLLQTWIDYRMVRLDLHGDLGLPPAEK